MKYLFLKLFVVTCFLLSCKASAQSCSGCITNVDSTSNASYTVATGQTFCIDSLGEFTGTITINGGTVCNRGIFRPSSLALSSGTIQNYCVFQCDSTVTLDNGFAFLNGNKGIFNFKKGFVITNGTVDNQGIISVRNDLTFTAGTLVNISIMNCRHLLGTGVNSILNSGIINTKEL